MLRMVTHEVTDEETPQYIDLVTTKFFPCSVVVSFAITMLYVCAYECTGVCVYVCVHTRACMCVCACACVSVVRVNEYRPLPSVAAIIFPTLAISQEMHVSSEGSAA